MAWHVKTTGAYSGTEAEDNARMIYNILSDQGWTLNAIAGAIGNMQAESGLNPWRWQGDTVLASDSSLLDSTEHGYGLVQFTPANKYVQNATGYTGYGPNFSDQIGSEDDGAAQMMYLDAEGDYIEHSSYPLSYAEYKVSTESAYYLGKVWLINYERPGDQSEEVQDYRGNLAQSWYDTLSGETPVETYSITVNVVGNGTAYATPSENVEAGTTVTLHETPSTGATFTGYTIISGDVTIGANFSFTMPAEDVIIQATFEGGETPPSPEPEKKKSKWIYYMRPAYIR